MGGLACSLVFGEEVAGFGLNGLGMDEFELGRLDKMCGFEVGGDKDEFGFKFSRLGWDKVGFKPRIG